MHSTNTPTRKRVAPTGEPPSVRDQAGGQERHLLRQAENPVVFFSNGIGDSLLSLPAMRALTALFPKRLTLICPRAANRLCYFALPFRRVVELQTVSENGQRGGMISLSPELFDARHAAAEVGSCDIFFSLVPWHSDRLEELVYRLIPHTTVGLFSFYDVRVRLPGRVHASDMAFEVPRAVESDLHIEDYARPPKLSDLAYRNARRLRGELPVGARLLVVHPDTSPERCWVPERFVKVLDAFLDRRREFFVFVVGRSYDNLEQGRHADRVVSCMGLPLDFTVALVGQADLFLGVNSSMLHAADLFRVPGVGLFGPGSTQDWGFRFGPHHHVIGTNSVADIPEDALLPVMEDLLN
jgi:hypothetical protein